MFWNMRGKILSLVKNYFDELLQGEAAYKFDCSAVCKMLQHTPTQQPNDQKKNFILKYDFPQLEMQENNVNNVYNHGHDTQSKP